MKRESEWSPKEKLELLTEAMACSEGDLGALLRRRGVHEARYQQWRQAALAGLTGAEETAKVSRKERREQERRVQRLERELHRKDKALAETAALLVLQKKLPSILGFDGRRTRALCPRTRGDLAADFSSATGLARPVITHPL